jgi:hypothetical protein
MELSMSVLLSPQFLRSVLLLDAASVLASGVPQVAVTAWLASLTGLPSSLLMATGVFLLCYGAFASWVGTRRPIPAAAVWLIIMGNLAWGVACVGLIGVGPFGLTGWGVIYLLLHGVAVTSFAALQVLGVRQSALQGVAANGPAQTAAKSTRA